MLLLATAIALQAAPVSRQQSCQSAAPPVGSNPVAAFPSAVDGARYRTLRDVARLRARSGTGLLVVRGGDYTGNKAGRLKLSNICFLNSKLHRTDWRGADTSGLGFIRSDLSGAIMTGARLPGVLLRETNLADVDASGAVMDGGRIDGGWAGSLARLKLDRARLNRFQVICGSKEEDGCPFDRSGMSIRETDFTNANLATFSFWDTALDGAILDNTHVGMQQIGQLDRLVVRGPIIIHSPHRRATLEPDEYLTVRQGVRPVSKVATREERVAVDPASCASTTDRRARALCQGGNELQSLAGDAEKVATANNQIEQFNLQQNLCANLSDDLVGRCLQRVYRATIATRRISPGSGRPEQLRGTTLFASLPVSFTEGFRRSPLYTRVLPLFIDASPTQLVALVGGDGRVSLSGGSQGGCRVAARGLRFNPATGWYVSQARVNRGRGGATVSRSVPVVRFTANGAEFASNPSAAVVCPDGANLDPAMRVDAPAELIDLLAEPFES